jgi:hypothetical protein
MHYAHQPGSIGQVESCREAVLVPLAQLRDLLHQLRRAQNPSGIEAQLSAAESALDDLTATLARLDASPSNAAEQAT